MEQKNTNTVAVTIDGRKYDIPAGTTILDACEGLGLDLPTLCYLKDMTASASCGVCVVEVKGAKSLLRSCVTSCAEGMEITTASPRVVAARRLTVELMLANHPKDCLSCVRNGACELQSMAERLGIRTVRFPPTRKTARQDVSSPSILRDDDKCILCGRCVSVCREVQTVSAIDFAGRGIKTRVAPFMDRGLASSVCTNCGQCSLVCPVGAIVERDDTEAVRAAIGEAGRTVVVQTAPAVRASLGDALGLPPGTLVTGKMTAALRRLGFDKVFDTQFAADLTIMEEGTELLKRMKGSAPLPMITSCSPGWISFIETFYPSLLPHLSTCKSPQQMFGAVAKTWFAEKAGIDPERMTVVSIMPCTAKKYEAKRPEMDGAWEYWRKKGKEVSVAPFADVDYALTVRELARMIKEVGLDIAKLPEEEFDDPLGESTGAATIFGTTGGVMEAALRTVAEIVTGKPLEKLEFEALRGLEGIKSASVDLSGTKVNVAVGHSLKNARILLDQIAAGKSPYAFIEVMTCPGGCIGGGGNAIRIDKGKRAARQSAIYLEDASMPVRKSHENQAVKALYDRFLIEPLGELSHELLHTTYAAKVV
jgi:iron-only hydrogenase group A